MTLLKFQSGNEIFMNSVNVTLDFKIRSTECYFDACKFKLIILGDWHQGES